MNGRKVLSLVFIALFAAGVFAQTQTMRIAGVTRTYIVHAPTGVTNPPLVLNIHGFDMSASSEQGYTQMDRIADREGFIVVYPDALPNSANKKSWDLSGPNDFAFMLAIVDSIGKRYSINRRRVYACGFSQGGFMSFQLACRYADIFAAIAPTSGLLSGACTPSRPVPVRLTFGTKDVATPDQFMQSAAKWIEINGCPSTPVVTRPYPTTLANSVVTRLYYGPCSQGTEVVVDSIRTGGHEWPMNTNDRINNSEETWNFLKKFSLPATLVGPVVQPLSAGNRISLTCVSGTVRLQGAPDRCQVRVYDARGRLSAATVAIRGAFDFKGRPGGVYMAVVSGKNSAVPLRMMVP